MSRRISQLLGYNVANNAAEGERLASGYGSQYALPQNAQRQIGADADAESLGVRRYGIGAYWVVASGGLNDLFAAKAAEPVTRAQLPACSTHAHTRTHTPPARVARAARGRSRAGWNRSISTR